VRRLTSCQRHSTVTVSQMSCKRSLCSKLIKAKSAGNWPVRDVAKGWNFRFFAITSKHTGLEGTAVLRAAFLHGAYLDHIVSTSAAFELVAA